MQSRINIEGRTKYKTLWLYNNSNKLRKIEINKKFLVFNGNVGIHSSFKYTRCPN